MTTLFAYALPGPPQSFSAKAAAVVEAVTTNHQQLRLYRGMRELLFLLPYADSVL